MPLKEKQNDSIMPLFPKAIHEYDEQIMWQKLLKQSAIISDQVAGNRLPFRFTCLHNGSKEIIIYLVTANVTNPLRQRG